MLLCQPCLGSQSRGYTQIVQACLNQRGRNCPPRERARQRTMKTRVQCLTRSTGATHRWPGCTSGDTLDGRKGHTRIVRLGLYAPRPAENIAQRDNPTNPCIMPGKCPGLVFLEAPQPNSTNPIQNQAVRLETSSLASLEVLARTCTRVLWGASVFWGAPALGCLVLIYRCKHVASPQKQRILRYKASATPTPR